MPMVLLSLAFDSLHLQVLESIYPTELSRS